MKLGDVLSARRRAIQMSFDELSQKTGVPVSTLKKVFTGVTANPSMKTIRAIAHALDLSLDDLDGNSNPADLTLEEMALLNRYRALDSHGKRMVDCVLKEEFARHSGVG